jgi:hypothetical protein
MTAGEEQESEKGNNICMEMLYPQGVFVFVLR